jgi:hypothetical protein
VLIEEPGRVIIQEGGRAIIRHNDADRFRWQAQDVRTERRGADTVMVFERLDGSRIYTVTDESGRLLRRYRRTPDGREIMIIDNRYSGPPSPFGFFVDLPPPVVRIPRERYIVEAQGAQPYEIDDALWAAPVDYIDRPYTLDEIRYTLPLRERMPLVPTWPPMGWLRLLTVGIASTAAGGLSSPGQSICRRVICHRVEDRGSVPQPRALDPGPLTTTRLRWYTGAPALLLDGGGSSLPATARLRIGLRALVA